MPRLHTLGGLWIEGDPALPPLGPRRMGLLAIVAAAGRKGITRDRVIGILWPERDEESARHTLAQNLYSLKQQAGQDALTALPELRLGPGFSSDVGELRDALEADDLETAFRLYTGDFLDGFYLPGVSEFERWAEDERARLRSAVIRAHERLAARLDERAGHGDSVRVWRRLTELDPLSARYAAGTMRALAAIGDRPAALAHFRAYEETVRRELESDPDPAVRQLEARLRSGVDAVEPRPPASLTQDRALAPDPVAERAHRHAQPGPEARDPAPSAEPVPDSTPPMVRAAAATPPAAPPVPAPERPGRARRRSFRRIAAFTVLVALPVTFGLRSLLNRPGTAPPLLAVGSIRDPSVADSGSVVRDMLATGLGAIEGLTVVANSRLVELSGTGGGNHPADVSQAARRSGASEIIEGEITVTDGGLTLGLRRIDLATGVVRKGYMFRGEDRVTLVAGAAAGIAREFGLESPDTDLALARSASPQAYLLYQEGLRAYFSGGFDAAWRLMNAALEHDSTFAMAAFYTWLLRRGDEEQLERIRLRARRLAPRAIDRERLLIEGTLSLVDAPAAVSLAIAETLSVRYPVDMDGQQLLGEARFNAGDVAGSVAAFERAVAMDSAAGLVASSFCRVCFALSRMAEFYLWWDSAPSAERVARRLIRFRPDDGTGWGLLLEPLLRLGRRAEAEAAAVQRERLVGDVRWPLYYLNRDLIRAGRYDELDREMRAAMHNPSPVVRQEARWVWLIGLRDQGRLAEAMDFALNGVIPGTGDRMPDRLPEPVHVMFLPFEAGQPLVSAVQFRERAARERASSAPPGLRARSVTWSLTLSGTAYAMAGDTAAVRALADTVEQTGRESNFGRDVRLHHFLRGLLLQAEGRHADAVAAFQRAMFSTADGYTRINLGMARSLLALGRATEAIAVLHPALRGGIDGSNTYLTRTEIHEALADAFAAAAMPDSAAAHYRAVEHAWRQADPIFRARYERARTAAARTP